jgi:mono/diheme cytochrome c family protein
MTHRYRSTIALLAFCGGTLANAAPSPLAAGKQVFDRWCSACHAPDIRSPGTTALAAKYGKEQPAALEQRTDLSGDVVRFFVRHGVSIMPPFRKTEITDPELNALTEYLARKPRRGRK